MPVKFVPVADYAAVVEAIAADRIDLAWLGGFTLCNSSENRYAFRWCNAPKMPPARSSAPTRA
jgi:ABC-type phosphate/phosphonate transport system substrate-binding protein